MTVAIAQIARELTMSRSELERRSLEAFIERERRLVNLDIADLQDRYGVRTAHELSGLIETKAVYSHPAWEEMIEWERLEAYLERLDNAPDHPEIATHPKHFHNGAEENVEESHIPDSPRMALREFLRFVDRELTAAGE